MKKYFLFIAFLFIYTQIMAVNLVTNGSFEIDPAADWTLLNQGTLPSFERIAAASHTGSFGYHVAFNAADPVQKANFTTKTNIDWKAGKSYTVSFWYKSLIPNTGTNSNLQVWIGGVKLLQYNLSLEKTVWTKHEQIVTPTSDGAGYLLLSLRPNSNSSGDHYIDDISVEEIVVEPDFFGDLKSKDVASDPTIQWTQFGPGMSGNNVSLYWHPTDPTVQFTAPNMGNSYRSTDKGFTYQTIFNEDAPGIKGYVRGPQEIFSLDFSRQNADFGFCTDQYREGLFKTEDRGKTWTRFANATAVFNKSYLACVAVDPTDENIWYVGAGVMRDYYHIEFPKASPHGDFVDASSQCKVWKSIDKGVNWTLITTGLHAKAEVETIIVDPVNSSIVYATTNYGFYKSTNGGTTWIQKTNGFDTDVFRSMVMHQNKSTSPVQVTLFALSDVKWKASGETVTDSCGGIFKSTDKGETWTKINGNLALNMSQFNTNTSIKTSYYNTIAYYFGITVDEAKVQYPNLPTSITQRFNLLEVDPLNADNIYVNNNYSNASTNNFKPGQLWRTKDGGQTWFVTLRNGTNWNSGSDLSFWSNRGNPLGTNVTFRNMSEWLNRYDYEVKSCNFARFSADGKILSTQMAKIGFISYDHGDTWIDVDEVETTPNTKSWVGAGNSNVPGHGFYQDMRVKNSVFCPGGENGLWMTNDEGDKVRSGAQAATAMRILPDEHSVSCYAVHPKDTMIRYVTFFRQAQAGNLLKSTDAGKTWVKIGSPVPTPWPVVGSGDQSVHQLNLIIDSSNPNNMYFNVPASTLDIGYVGNTVTGQGIHKSIDGGVNWTTPNTGLPTKLDVAKIAFSPFSCDTLYAAVMNTGGGLYMSADKGENWAEVQSTTSLRGTTGVNDITFGVDGKAYITTGYKNVAADGGGLWVSGDNLKTWKKVFDYPWVYRVEVAKYDPKTILISTLPNTTVSLRNPGTYLSKDGGVNWVKINKGNGQSDRINDIAIEYNRPGRYYASTYGSGWYSAIDPIPSIPTKVDGISILEQNLFIEEGKDTLLTVNFIPTYAWNKKVIWSSNNTTVASVDNSGMLTGLKEGTAEITAISDYGGFVKQTNVIVTKKLNATVDTLDLSESKLYKPFPNPVNDILYFKGEKQDVQLEVFNSDGMIVKKMVGSTAIGFDMTNLPPGMYFFKIKNNLFSNTNKFIKK